jgi:hypothetical protein
MLVQKRAETFRRQFGNGNQVRPPRITLAIVTARATFCNNDRGRVLFRDIRKKFVPLASDKIVTASS